MEIAENFKFNSWKENPGELIQDFANALNKSSAKCGFENHLQNALRNQFVFGLESKRIQSRLLETNNLTFTTALSTALTMELCEKETGKLRSAKSDSVNYLHSDKNNYKKGGKSKVNNHNKNNNNYKLSDNATGDKAQIQCYRYGKFNHKANVCKLPKSVTCNSCNMKGHLISVSMKKNKTINQVEEAGCFLRVADIGVVDTEQQLHRRKIMKKLLVNGKPIDFEIDSGATVMLMWSGQAEQHFGNYEVHRSELQLVTFCSTRIKVSGFIKVLVSYENMSFDLNLYLTDVNRVPLCGREWICEFIKAKGTNGLFESILSIDTQNDANFDNDSFVKNTLQKYSNVTKDDLSKIRGMEATLTLKFDAKPVFLKARSVPFRLINLIDKELDSLEKEGVLEHVDTSLFGTSIVPILKRDGSIRICRDYSVTVNPQLIVNEFPLPTTDELFSDLAGCKYYAKIDCSKAYLQLPVDDESAKILTINTHRGLYKVLHLMFGIAAAPAIWQARMDFLFGKIEGVRAFQDDIRIAAST